MPRPKKTAPTTEEKAKEAGGPAAPTGDGATLQIDVASFMRTRDTFIGGLATLQEAIQSVSSAYIKHTNAVLGEHGAGYDIDTALSKLGENPFLGNLGALQRAASPVVAKATSEQAPEKKERKKRQHDPNAPKRPLTPFFLYMQTARPIIAKDLGDVPKGEVSSEGTKRWTDMAAKDKALWQDAYKDNLRLYNARMHSYRKGNITAKEMSDDAAAAYADEHNIGADTSADAQLVGEATAGAPAPVEEEEEDGDGEVEAEAETLEKTPTPEPAPKTPKAKASRKKAGGKTEVVDEVAAPGSASIVPPQKETSPARKRKRAGKKGVEDVVAEQEEGGATVVETPKSAPKSRKKKSKTEA